MNRKTFDVKGMRELELEQNVWCAAASARRKCSSGQKKAENEGEKKERKETGSDERSDV